MKVFLDANVLFSAAYGGTGPPSLLLDAAVDGLFQVVVSSDVLHEVVRNLAEKSPRGLPWLEWLFEQTSIEVTPDPAADTVGRFLDLGFAEDAPIVAAAIDAGVDYFCTGDSRLRRRASDAGLSLTTCTPRELADILGIGRRG